MAALVLVALLPLAAIAGACRLNSYGPPPAAPARGASRDRSLPGKARRTARKAAARV